MPNSTILMVCHSRGDAQMVLACAQALIKRDIKCNILPIGKAAQSYLDATLGEKKLDWAYPIEIFTLDGLLDTKPIMNNALALEPKDLQEVVKFLRFPEYDAVMIGTPSYTKVQEQCLIPEQLLNVFRLHLRTIVASDYAFCDPNHRVVKNQWFQAAEILLVPFQKAIKAMGAIPEKSVVVGLPAIDMVKEKFAGWLGQKNKFQDIQRALDVKPLHKLILVAGGKAGDEALLTAIASTCSKYEDLQIVVGLHPDADLGYVKSLSDVLDKYEVNKQIRFMPKECSNDEAMFAANGLLTVSSTMGTTAAECDKVVGFYQEGKPLDDVSIPYIVSDKKAHFYTKPDDLLDYYSLVRKSDAALTLKQLAVGKPAADKMADAVQTLLNRVVY